jgi:hypothetical protein
MSNLLNLKIEILGVKFTEPWNRNIRCQIYWTLKCNRHKQNSRFCKEIREDNFRFWWRRVHEDASQGMYMSKIEIFFFTARYTLCSIAHWRKSCESVIPLPRLVIGTSRTVGSAKKFVRITSGFGGGEFTKTLRKVCGIYAWLHLDSHDEKILKI